MNNKKKIFNLLFYIIGIVVLTELDQITKALAEAKLLGKPDFKIIGDAFVFSYLRNSGAAWGMLSGKINLFLVFTVIVMLIVTYVIINLPATRKYMPLLITCTLLVSGAVGNFIDRVRFGYVRDFIYFKLINFPVFNVADCYVTVSVALLIILCLDASVAAGRVKICIVRDYRRVFVLFKVCLPLAISTFLSNYIINSSKLSVDRMLGDAAQLYYTAVFMPNMVINLFSGIIFKPMQTSMAVNYYEKKYKNFWHIIFRMFAIIAGFTLICEVGAYILGIPVLSWLYGVNLKDYKMTLLLLLLCGGVNAVNIIFYYVLAIMRKQKYMTILYLIVCGVALIIMDPITGRLGLNGAALGYLILVVLLGVLLMGYILYQIRKDRKRQ